MTEDQLAIGDKITTMLNDTIACYATVGIIGTAYTCASTVSTVNNPPNPDEPAFVWSGVSDGGTYQNGWDRMSTEGYEWCRGHEGPAVDALRVARGLVAK